MAYLIDRNKLYNHIKTEINPYGKPFKGTVYEFGCELMDYLLDMEVVEAVPAVHGKWDKYKISKLFEYTCTNCHVDVNERTPYCPWCGTRMDGE